MQAETAPCPTLEQSAGQAVRAAIKSRARHYQRWPGALEALHPGLGCAPPVTLVAIAEHLVEREAASPRRWFGFGGDVCLVNARGALLLGRLLRRQAYRENEVLP